MYFPCFTLPLLWVSLVSTPTFAQAPPPLENGNLKVIKSPTHLDITVLQGSPAQGTCTTVFPTQKQYVGHVILPPMALAPIQQNYSINTFFWFIEAREKPETAPLTIWLSGRPGTSSMVGLFQENGPCEVIEFAKDKLGTKAREWGWDRSSNMLYIDQPNEVGFSYDTPTNGFLNLLTGQIAIPPAEKPEILPQDTFLTGIFSSNNENHTTNTTKTSALAIWHMLQGFLAEFPQYTLGGLPDANTPSTAGINLFTESYGGKYGPTFAAYWQSLNALRNDDSSLKSVTLDLDLQSLGILNGCVDDPIQLPSLVNMASNNTYGIQALSSTQAQTLKSSTLDTANCGASIKQCTAAESSLDPNDYGNVSSVNDLCSKAYVNCNNQILSAFTKSGKSVYDIAHGTLDPFPPSLYREYLNSENLHQAIDAQINYTESNAVVQSAFNHTGDWERGNQVSDLASLLSSSVRVALIYGDRDWICNWMGGEEISFSIAGSHPSTYSPFLSDAGYADIVVNDSYVGGQVRQYGNLSFSRIYDAGHLVPAYQPETAFTVFTRVLQGVDISTGKPADLRSFLTEGDANSTHTNSAPPSPSPTCWLRNVQSTCTDEQKTMLQQGKGVIINGRLYDEESDWQGPAASGSSQAGTTATGQPPKSTKKGAANSSKLADFGGLVVLPPLLALYLTF